MDRSVRSWLKPPIQIESSKNPDSTSVWKDGPFPGGDGDENPDAITCTVHMYVVRGCSRPDGTRTVVSLLDTDPLSHTLVALGRLTVTRYPVSVVPRGTSDERGSSQDR